MHSFLTLLVYNENFLVLLKIVLSCDYEMLHSISLQEIVHHSHFNGLLGCFQFSLFVNNFVMNIITIKSLCTFLLL